MAGTVLPPVLEQGDLCLDPARRVATRGGTPLPLNPKELAVLVFFMFRNSRKRKAQQAELQHLMVPGAYVMTNDQEQAMRVADRIDAGMVFVNAVGAEGVELPFGGVKRSGFGRELGRFGIDEFVNKKLIRIT